MSTQELTSGRTRRRDRVAAVAGATAAAAAIWIVVVPVLGHDLEVERWNDGAVTTVTLAHVIVTALVASLAAWGSLAVLARLASRGATAWAIGASVLSVLSLWGPMSASTEAATAITLSLMHLVVAVVLIPTLVRSVR